MRVPRHFSLNSLLTTNEHISEAARAFVRHAGKAWQWIDLHNGNPLERSAGSLFNAHLISTADDFDVPTCRALVLRHIRRMDKSMSYLSRLAEYADAMLHGPTAQQVGSLCYRKGANESVEVLLITTRETRRWTIPKGWTVKGLEPHQAAKLEAWEEAGVKGKVKRRPFGYFTYVKTLSSGEKVPSLVQVHLLETRSMRSHFPERGQRELVWLPALEASLLVNEPELKGLLGKFSRRTAFR